jgi:hypothetical protein
VELITRVSVEPLGPEEGLLREALSSQHSLFATTREILRRHGPGVAMPSGVGGLSFGYLAVSVMNGALRPFLATWYPALAHNEASRDPAVAPVEHERNWELAAELRRDLAEVRPPSSPTPRCWPRWPGCPRCRARRREPQPDASPCTEPGRAP